MDRWPVAPRLLEDVYTAADAVVVGGLLISLLRHADRVTSASLAQLVNVIAPIMTEPDGPAWRQSIFHPFALTAAAGRCGAATSELDAPTHPTGRYGDVPIVDAVATRDETGGARAVHGQPVDRRRRERDVRPERARPSRPQPVRSRCTSRTRTRPTRGRRRTGSALDPTRARRSRTAC